ncbi:DUF1194 domain-containing protein [Ensifer adhaerens]|uniref:DUF1194 domain-containing protein n=1 Tax=Ensifer adhaerens TaxID=106592 RepID=UPI001CBDF5A2|nr:DUF1194 domain-containing protein [Ensifer adhaerens]MBZ7922287.1 DUF1194 domain-containing protein [Ensifer adhaerens]UAX90927.1 DUF1194 domain-containing protein [Ensifer adhaerens]UAX98556.1 DUF1194 domain-containing protein [Ensifer adhaerens]UAY05937.1 DUF1194 domain-containing protein [Ensifer adhaerens]
MVLRSVLLACAFLLCGSTSAEPFRVDLELVLAVDVSYSMELDEQRIQRQGYVAAFLEPALIEAVANGPLGRIAVTYVEWGGAAVQVTPWTLIDGRGTAAQYSELLGRQPIRRIAFTSISNTLAFTRRLFDLSPFEGSRRVIDISGDGPNNSGVPAPVARNSTVARGITIDGLPIMLKTQQPDSASIPDLDAYYRECVIGGDGAFLVKVTDSSEFAKAILRKLVTEISGQEVSRLDRAPVRPAQYGKDYNCFIGEEMQERMIGR